MPEGFIMPGLFSSCSPTTGSEFRTEPSGLARTQLGVGQKREFCKLLAVLRYFNPFFCRSTWVNLPKPHLLYMKRPLLMLTILVAGMTSRGQFPEFHTYANGLIYDDSTMGRLKFIVDSLQLKFKTCDLYKSYFSVRQGKANYILLDSINARSALADMRQNISYDEFIRKYPLAAVDSFVLVKEEDDENVEHRPMLAFTSHAGGGYRDPSIHVFKNSDGKVDSSKWSILGMKGRWVFYYSKYGNEKLEAYYLLQIPTSQIIPEKYSRLVLYSDCMIDTGTTVFYKEAKEDRRMFMDDENKKDPYRKRFDLYVEKNTRNILSKYHLKKSASQFYIEDSLKQVYINDSLSSKPEFRRLLSAAANEAIRSKCLTDARFEYYVELYYSKGAALRMKRNRRVIGTCSQDQSPRIHALEIAMLAAETADWQVFLKAHLDILNDHFERNTDGSYAWGKRNTYIKELEDLDIDVPDLLLGISLQIVNPSENHYFGTIRRLGRALAETRDRPLFEEKVLEMIKDSELDDFNRLVQHYLFLNFMYYLPEKADRLSAIQKLEDADRTLPGYIASRLKIDHKSIEAGPNNGW